MTDINIDAWAAKLAGVAGAAISMRFLQGSPLARVSMAISGSLVSYYAAPHIAQLTGMPDGLTGFLLGVFGMAVVSRMWQWVEQAPIALIWQAVVDRIRGKGGV